MQELIYPADSAPLLDGCTYTRSAEMLPIVDENLIVRFQAPRDYCHNELKVIHPVVHLHIINRNGELYLQKRSADKDFLPSFWDTAVGGHVSYGEHLLEALFREASEELGLRDFSPTFLKSYVFESPREKEFVNVFACVGNFEIDELRPLVCQYIGSIPGTGKKEKAKDVIPYVPKGEYICHFSREMEIPRSNVSLTWAGKMKYNLQNRMRLNILHQVLDMLYVQTLRGEEGGTYGATTSYDLDLEPRDQYMLTVTFQTNAEKLETLLQRAKEGLKQIAEDGVSGAQFDKVVTYMHKRHNDLLRSNAYWMQVIQENNTYNLDNYTNYDRTLDAITPADIQQCARQVLASSSYIEVVMKGLPIGNK